MKIIQRGTPPQDRPIRGECRNCQTVFEFVQPEAKLIYDQRDGNYWHVNCPVCNYTVSADAKGNP